ncbi:hypothetical protein FLAT13_00319 [Flavobacterium salmonis]|uniref:Uncharacterized protein n=1 Tax=Flavobacterium salmonis TaxID=2654844 RepID=A0A6V6YNH5_9FLAO|nr:hypothetical protein FLAT13_00319 [Flavobacterium salmonis]
MVSKKVAVVSPSEAVEVVGTLAHEAVGSPFISLPVKVVCPSTLAGIAIAGVDGKV